MKKLILILLIAFAVNVSGQTCSPVSNVRVFEGIVNGKLCLTIGYDIGTGRATSIYINDTSYKDGNSQASIFLAVTGISLECPIVGEYKAGDIIEVMIRNWCTYPVSNDYSDYFFVYQFKNDFLCPTVKGHKGGKKK